MHLDELTNLSSCRFPGESSEHKNNGAQEALPLPEVLVEELLQKGLPSLHCGAICGLMEKLRLEEQEGGSRGCRE